jgi:DNA-binding NarL/FixJ family response regulator
MNSVDCLKELKKMPHLDASKIIIYSTSIDEKARTQSISLRVNTFLVKAPGLDQLKKELAEVLKKSNQNQNGNQKSCDHE